MSEQKVWVEKLPEYCDDCPCSLRDKDDCAYCNLLHKNIGYDFGKRPKHCPLQLIKDHDQELVKEVCEKIKQYFNENLGNCEEYHCCGFNGKNIEDIYGFLEKLQKEYDK